MRDQLVPADIVAGDGFLRADDVRQDHRRGPGAVAAHRADIAAGHVEKPVQLARRVVKAPGAGPAVGAAEDGAGAMGRVDPPQFRRDEIERPRPVDRHERVTAAPAVRRRGRVRASRAGPSARRSARGAHTEAGMLPSSGEGSGSRGCGAISMPPSRTSTENAPQCELCGSRRAAADVDCACIHR